MDSCVDLCLTRRMIERGCVVQTTTSSAPSTLSPACAKSASTDAVHCDRVCLYSGEKKKMDVCMDSCIMRRRKQRGCPVETTATAAATTATAASSAGTTTVSAPTTAANSTDAPSCVRPEDAIECQTSCQSNLNGALSLDICTDSCLEKRLVDRKCLDKTTGGSTTATATTRVPVVEGCFKATDAAYCASSCAPKKGEKKSTDRCVERCAKRKYAQRGCVWTRTSRPAVLTTVTKLLLTSTKKTLTTKAATTTAAPSCNSEADKNHCKATCFGSSTCERKCLKVRSRSCSTLATTAATTKKVSVTSKPVDTANGHTLRQQVLKDCVNTYMSCKSDVCASEDVERAFKSFQSLVTFISKSRSDKVSLRRSKRIRRQVVCLLSRIVTKRRRIVASAVKRVQKRLSKCNKRNASCRQRCLRRLGVARRRETRLLEISRVLVLQSHGAKSKCRKVVAKELSKAVKLVGKTSTRLAKSIVKQSTRIIKSARVRLLGCSSASCTKKCERVIRREKRVLRRGKKEQKKVRRVLAKAVVREVKTLGKLQAACAAKKCKSAARKAIRSEKKVLRILSGKKKAATNKVAKLQKRIDRKIAKLADSVTARRVRKNIAKVVKLEKRLVRTCSGKARCAIYVSKSLAQAQSNAKAALKTAAGACVDDKACVSKVKAVAALVKKQLSSVTSTSVVVSKGTSAGAKQLLASISQCIKKIGSSLTARGVKKHVAKLVKRERRLVALTERCKGNAKCFALVATAVVKATSKATRTIRRVTTEIGAACGGKKKCAASVATVARRSVKQLKKVSALVESRLLKLSCPLRMSTLRTQIQFERLRVASCAKDQKCAMRHRAQVHKLVADLAVGCSKKKEEKKKEEAVVVKDSVQLDSCDDATAEFHVSREKLNRELSVAYDKAADCKTIVCTTSSLVELRKLHLALNALKMPACNVPTLAPKTPSQI